MQLCIDDPLRVHTGEKSGLTIHSESGFIAHLLLSGQLGHLKVAL